MAAIGMGPRTDTQTRLRSGLLKPLREASRRVVRPRDQPDGIRCARRIMTKNCIAASMRQERRCRLSDLRHRRFQPDAALISQHRTRFADDFARGARMTRFKAR